MATFKSGQTSCSFSRHFYVYDCILEQDLLLRSLDTPDSLPALCLATVPNRNELLALPFFPPDPLSFSSFLSPSCRWSTPTGHCSHAPYVDLQQGHPAKPRATSQSARSRGPSKQRHSIFQAPAKQTRRRYPIPRRRSTSTRNLTYGSSHKW